MYHNVRRPVRAQVCSLIASQGETFPGSEPMAKTEFLQIRVTPEDRQRIDRVAAAAHLESSTWARQAILRAVEHAEGEAGPPELARARTQRREGAA